MFYSPLRYPGGKNKLAKFISNICVDNEINGHYVEPYAGGASVALYLLLEGRVKKITINDLDRSIYAFWWSVLNRTDELCELIEKTDVTVKTWRTMKEVQNNKDASSLLDLGFSTFFLNRTNYSGIINAWPIGGLGQKGKYKIDCRFNKQELINRIRNIAEHKNNINLCNDDALDLIDRVKKDSKNSNTILYLDPPYYLKGPSLYMNFYKDGDHHDIANKVKEIKNIHWIVSYDNQEEIKKLYNWIDNERKIEFNVQHYAYKTKKAKEILLLSPTFENVNFKPLLGT